MTDFKPGQAPNVVIYMDGGLIQNVECDQPVNIYVADYDTEGAEPDELVRMPSGDEAYPMCWTPAPDYEGLKSDIETLKKALDR